MALDYNLHLGTPRPASLRLTWCDRYILFEHLGYKLRWNDSLANFFATTNAWPSLTCRIFNCTDRCARNLMIHISTVSSSCISASSCGRSTDALRVNHRQPRYRRILFRCPEARLAYCQHASYHSTNIQLPNMLLRLCMLTFAKNRAAGCVCKSHVLHACTAIRSCLTTNTCSSAC